MYIYIYMCVRICVCIHVYEIDRFRSSHPGVFLKVGAPKVYGKSWKDIYEELHFSSMQLGENNLLHRHFQGLC